MNERDYKNYVEFAVRMGLPIFQNDFGTSPKDFGMAYIGSPLARKNKIRRKQLQKQFRK